MPPQVRVVALLYTKEIPVLAFVYVFQELWEYPAKTALSIQLL